jgi:hypothetical protein
MFLHGLHMDSFILMYSTLLHIPQWNINFSKPFSIVPSSYVYKKQGAEVRGWDSSVGIATGCGLDGLGIKSR